MSVQVRPVSSVLDVTDIGLTYAERFSYFSLFSPINPYRSDFFWSEFRGGIFDPALALVGGTPGSSFGSHVGEVVGVGAHPQMAGVATRRIVARVADKFSYWYRANSQLVRHAVRQLFVARPASYIEFPISFGTVVPNPRPTGIWSLALVNASPESFFNCLTPSHDPTLAGGDIPLLL